MQNENDDIERLFRRAAESYPLNTSGSNWEKVEEMLEKEKTDVVPLYMRFFEKRNLLIFLLLLAGAGIGLAYFFTVPASNKNEGQKKYTSILTPLNNNSPIAKKGINGDAKNTTGAPNLKEQKTKAATTSSYNNFNSISIHRGKTLAASGIPAKGFHTSKDSYFNRDIKSKQTKEYNLKGTNYVAESLTGSTGVLAKTDELSSVLNSSKGNSTADADQDKQHAQASLKTIQKDTLATVQQVSSGSSTKKVSKNGVTKYKKYFYGSLIAGPDVSNIKQQSYGRTGLSTGAILGYRWNRLSAEAGVLWDKKYYETDGKYFNAKTSTGGTSYLKIISVDGLCNMYEIPLNIAYHLNTKSRGDMYIKSGLSSYFMKSESYNYYYKVYTNTPPYNVINTSNASYKNSSNTLFAALNFGAGYAYNLTRSFAAGLEGYYRLPIRNIGTGRMPISSSGIYLTLTKKIK